jgi:hypothetical protein
MHLARIPTSSASVEGLFSRAEDTVFHGRQQAQDDQRSNDLRRQSPFDGADY